MPLIRRDYVSYDEYVSHQQQKLQSLYHYKFHEGVDERLGNFRDRIRHAARHLSGDAVLCLGARFGEEVTVFRDLGFTNSIGIDIAPAADESLVRYGDFHNTNFPDDSFDAAYTNAVDHVFQLDRFAEEAHRVIRPGGHLILAATNAFESDDVDKRDHINHPTKFESLLWDSEHDLLDAFLTHFSLVERFNSTAWSETVFVLIKN